MKSKRQTVWLVSMLSLMVVLSAYYLFTEDSSTRNQSATGEQVSSINNEKTPGTAANDEMLQNDDVVLSEIMGEDGKTEVVTEEKADGTASQNSGEAADAGGTAGSKEAADEAKADTGAPDASGAAEDASGTKEGASASKDNAGNKGDSAGSAAAGKDEDVLKQLESQGKSAADSLTAYQFQRSEQNAKKQDELMQAINDGNKSLDEAAMAQQELSALEERQEKIYDIEEKLQQTYANAVVTESEDKYKVLVVSEKLEAKEAVNIMDLVIKELGVSQDKVSVQYVTQ
ncbi:SpoIIIAH-like family protein [Paenibacillus sp. alder61]|uniref:SpoIIIAH-like family protein n=1 Tax=Paenibacillus sp. alder61 TaxID=2862948 RepID=UPI001CD4214A|nr:SpoIIIAH-like family protein [Paenibacillus sp. alder61]MCA1295887.1 SpoIIIAH-like family protein [Paenibacillus sp. alder61]